jgi:NADPH2:quinone reductase
VLVLGASGGVGSVIVSLAHSLGATVWGQTGSEEKRDFVAAQGADDVVVGGPEAVADAAGRLQPTVVLDPLGGEFVRPVVEGVAPRGTIVSFGVSAGPEVSFNLQTLYRKSARIVGYGGMTITEEERREGLRTALDALAAGRLKIPIDSVLPLDEVGEAFARLERREVSGKLLLDVG